MTDLPERGYGRNCYSTACLYKLKGQIVDSGQLRSDLYGRRESSPGFLYVQTGAVFTILILCFLAEPRWGYSVDNEASPLLLYMVIKDKQTWKKESSLEV